MTQEETISYLKAYLDGDTAIGNIIPLRSVLEFAIKYLEPSLPSNLDEAANDFVWEVMENDEEGISELSKKLRPTSKISDFYDALGAFFKAGAEWMAEQGWSRELEVEEDAGGYPYIDKHIELYDYDTDTPLAKKGDKVVVQIRKA